MFFTLVTTALNKGYQTMTAINGDHIGDGVYLSHDGFHLLAKNAARRCEGMYLLDEDDTTYVNKGI